MGNVILGFFLGAIIGSVLVSFMFIMDSRERFRRRVEEQQEKQRLEGEEMLRQFEKDLGMKG